MTEILPPLRTTHLFDAAGGRWCFDLWAGAGRPVVLVPAVLFDRTCWWPTAADLRPYATVVAVETMYRRVALLFHPIKGSPHPRRRGHRGHRGLRHRACDPRSRRRHTRRNTSEVSFEPCCRSPDGTDLH